MVVQWRGGDHLLKNKTRKVALCPLMCQAMQVGRTWYCTIQARRPRVLMQKRSSPRTNEGGAQAAEASGLEHVAVSMVDCLVAWIGGNSVCRCMRV